jgi:peptide/nickel transport system permease protein
MLNYLLKRLLYALPIAFVVSALCFALVYLAPGDPLSAVLPADASQEMVEAVKARYGLDKPLVQQYGIWLGRALHGDLGQSISTGRAVSLEIGSAIGNSILLAVLASALGFGIGGLLGVIAGYLHGTATDRFLSALAIAGVSIPHYWLGIVLVAIFAVQLNLLPAMGAGPGGSGSWLWNAEHLRYIILPAVTLAAIPAGIVMRTVRALVADTLKQEFIVGLVAKGMGSAQVFRHLVKNIAPTALAVIGVQLGYLMAGSILVETVFNWPGTGLLLNTAILQRDIPLLQGTILVLAMIFVLLNLLVDMIQPLLDPRIVRS